MQIEIRGAERLSFRERQVVALKEMGLGNQEVARRLGLGPASVATLYHRAKTKGYQVVIVLEDDPLGLFTPDAGNDDAGADEAGPERSEPATE